MSLVCFFLWMLNFRAEAKVKRLWSRNDLINRTMHKQSIEPIWISISWRKWNKNSLRRKIWNSKLANVLFKISCNYTTVAGRESQQHSAEGKCWQKDVLNLDAEWTSVRANNGQQHQHQQHHQHHHRRHQYLPELEPMRTEMRPPYGIQSPNHHVTVRMTIPHGGVAHLPCPVRQLGNKTAS